MSSPTHVYVVCNGLFSRIHFTRLWEAQAYYRNLGDDRLDRCHIERHKVGDDSAPFIYPTEEP